MKNKIIITGGTGFVGTHLAQKFIKANYDVEIWDINDHLKRYEHSNLSKCPNVSFQKTDLSVGVPKTNYKSVRGIYHLAALPHVDYSRYEPRQVIQNNVQCLLNILDLSLKQDIPVIFSSSVEVYGGKDTCIYTEKDKLNPLSPYAASKEACEGIINSYVESFGLKANILRFTNLYGPWQAPDRLVPRILTQAISGIDCQIEAGTIRDFLYIDDACEALMKLLDLHSFGDVFNLSSGRGYDNSFVGKLVQSQNQFSSKFYFISPKKNDGRGKSLVSSPKKLQQAIAWKQTIEIEQGIQATFNWYKGNRIWWNRFEKSFSSTRDSKHFIIDSMNWKKEAHED